jgi:hypothetical protein
LLLQVRDKSYTIKCHLLVYVDKVLIKDHVAISTDGKGQRLVLHHTFDCKPENIPAEYVTLFEFPP